MRTKTITTSLRLRPDELEVIESNAEKAGLNRNTFIVSSALKNHNSVKPEHLCELRMIQNTITRVDNGLTDKIRNELNERINKLWATLSK